MFRKNTTLDTPFSTGEKVQLTTQVGDLEAGTEGKVKLSNGLGVWRRYWVRFSDTNMVGQISHQDLVRPKHLGDWLARKESQELAASQAAVAPAESSEAGASAAGAGSHGIPEALLEKSRAAKKRLLG